MSLGKKKWWIKLTNWEYWPGWILYIPVFVQHFWLAFKAKNLFFFLRTNPAIDGFILSDSKFKTLQLVPESFKPRSFLVKSSMGVREVQRIITDNELSYPLILKPDIGYRGLSVYKLEGINDLKKALSGPKIDYLLQEYVNGEVEAGIFYYRLPSKEKGCIPSITLKEFLRVTGNGQDSLKELVNQNPRAILQEEKIASVFADQWNVVIPDKESLLLEDIGNHNRGTKFVNANNMVSDKLLEVFDQLSYNMPGFYYGRFDIRAESWEEIEEGNTFKILEVNGVGGEPTHVYDSGNNLLSAWKDMLFIWKVGYLIAMENIREGESKPTFEEANSKWKIFRKYQKIAFGK